MSKSFARSILIVFPVAVFLLLLSCDKGIEPPVPPKNPRDYTWAADTFYDSFTPSQTMLTRLWGSSSQNVYVTGRTSTGTLMYRYDGSKWSSLILPRPEGLGAFFNFSNVWGFGTNDIYAVGAEYFYNTNPPPAYFDSSLVIHFDGISWRQISLPQRETYLNRVWGDAPNNVFIGGGKSIWHFEGGVWNKEPIPILISSGSFFGIDGLTGNSIGNVYATFFVDPVAGGAKRVYYFLGRNSTSWSVLDSAIVEPGNVQRKWGYADLWTSPSGAMYSISEYVFRWQDGSWQTLFQTPVSLAKISGSSDSNIFVTGPFGTIIHFNGVDWFQFSQFVDNNVGYIGIWTDGQELFIAGTTNNGAKTIILHGR